MAALERVEVSPAAICAAWTVMAAGLVLAVWAFIGFSSRFGPDIDVAAMPARELAASIVAAGLLFLLMLPLIRITLGAGLGDHGGLLIAVVIIGLFLRLLMFSSTPALEDDWNRYLWDGAVAAHGYNPYAVSPDDAQGEPYHYTLQPLAHASGTVIENVNHPHLKTIYPPVAQSFFVLAHVAEPYSLRAWRGVLVLAELATLALLVAILRQAGKSPLWAALYWWNPAVLKEIINSAHMDGIVMPFVLGACLLSLRARPIAAAGVLGLAAGAKLWPVVLAPLLLRPLFSNPRQLFLACALLALLIGLWCLPVILGGLDATSGFVAFGQYWRTNSAHFPVLEEAAKQLLSGLSLPQTVPGVIVRGLLASAVAVIAFQLARGPIGRPENVMGRAALTVAALFLLSPVQFPWYALWMLPFLCVRPSLALLAAVALTPIYYASFYYMARGDYTTFRQTLVWLIWVPVWALLAVEYWQARTRKPEAAPYA